MICDVKMFSRVLDELNLWILTFCLSAPGQIGFWVRQKIITRRLAMSGSHLSIAPLTWWNGYENIQLGNDVSVGRGCIFESTAGTITIGNNVGFNSNCTLGADFGSIIIGNNVIVGMNTVMRAANHRFDLGNETLIRDQGHVGDEINIADDVWIGACVTILAGVHIGSHSVVGAGSVVTQDVPPSSLVAGVPARVIRKL